MMRRLLTKIKRSGHAQATQTPRNAPAVATFEHHEPAEPATLTDISQSEPTEAPTMDKEEPTTGPDMIERLPPEVRRQILSALNLFELQSLVRASPVLHAQYVNDRTYILCRSLEGTLRGATADAYAVHRLSTVTNTERRDMPGFLTSLYENRATSLVGRVKEDEIVTMVALYRSVKAVIPPFMKWTLEEDNHKEPSRTEALRLHRAIYRYQLMCLIASPSSALGRRVKVSSLATITNLFEPWEVEEMYSFYQYIEEMHGRKIHKVRWDIPDAMNIDTSFLTWNPPNIDPVARGYAAGLALRGLAMFFDVLDVKYDQLLAIMQQNLVMPEIMLDPDWPSSVVSQEQQMARFVNRPTWRDQLMMQRKPLPFRGDVEPSQDIGVDKLPPVAWTMIWDGIYSSLHGFYTSHDLRRWGYVFWDETTMVNLQGERVLRVQWEQNWGGLDPRDALWAARPR